MNISFFSIKNNYFSYDCTQNKNQYVKSFSTKQLNSDCFTPSFSGKNKEQDIEDFDAVVLDVCEDRIFGYDTSTAHLRDEMRTSILSKFALNDEEYQVKNPPSEMDSAQLPHTSKYYELGTVKINKKDGSRFFIFDNLMQAPDNNGVRGKTPLSGDAQKLKWRLKRAKEEGITRIIDLRSKGECSSRAKKVMEDYGIQYLNFPVEDEEWTKESLNDITAFIKMINAGDFYVGCANGEARTDIAVSINYVFNPEAKVRPELFFGTQSSSRVSVKKNLSMILALISENKEIIKDWGWDNYDDFSKSVNNRYSDLLFSIKT
ncbi:hypothetical protein IJD44_01240 [bacterium]|nr:hypothetical protein [bacterium]